ncbi:unnamed protein product [Paramecium sonneborni]|uniref:Uncharacterized protein n=1 Tax=Paramecium sonneborni TaxID=65129 RepID=A0A8S1R9J9_9CILI|nr:unnamed protein product [Paramecium sonneborni]
MKSPFVIENERRTKTNPDQNSLISYSTTKSYASSERKTQVKVACKVLCEMREDESSKLAMKFTQLRIVLATQSLLHKLQKYKSAKLQTYFWILQKDRKTIQANGFLDLNQTISLPPVIEDLSNNQIRQQIQPDQYQEIPIATGIVLNHVLNKIVNQQQRQALKRIKYQSNYCKGLLKISNFVKECQIRSQYLSILNIMRYHQNKKILKTSVLDQNQMIQQEDEESSINQQEEMTLKEQLAIKFASTTMLSSILNEKIKKHQFSLFFNIVRGQFQNKQLSFSQTNEITQIEQSFLEQNPNRIEIGTQRLYSILNEKLKEYFLEIKTFQQENEQENRDTVNTLISKKSSEQSDNDSYQDLYTQRILPTQSKQFEQETENGLQISERNMEFKMPCSLQHITDIDDSTKEGEQKKQESELEQQQQQQQQQRKVIQQKNKNQDLIKNAVKSYCNQQQRKQSFQETPRISQWDQSQVKDVQENKKEIKRFYIHYMIGICMTVLIILILQ